MLAGWKEGDVVSGEGTGGSRYGGTVRGGPWRSRPRPSAAGAAPGSLPSLGLLRTAAGSESQLDTDRNR